MLKNKIELIIKINKILKCKVLKKIKNRVIKKKLNEKLRNYKLHKILKINFLI